MNFLFANISERMERMSLDSGDFGRQGSASSGRSVQSRDKDVIDNHDDPRMKLILELSEQVATLDSENSNLKQELKHCRKITGSFEKIRAQKRKTQGTGRTEIVYVDKSNSSWKGLESGRTCVEITDQA
jgi:hypothetical protein